VKSRRRQRTRGVKAQQRPTSDRYASPAKLLPPSLGKIYERTRLFKALDSARERPVVWISAPAGSGKTTLVASYLKNRKLPCLWYQVDEGDSDSASFFYYLGIAAQRLAPRRKPLPLLTPEYLAGVPVFTRNFFRELFSRLHAPGVVVLDNYQKVASESALDELLALGLTEVPQGTHVIVISRNDPPPSLARLLTNEYVSQLDRNELQLSADESSAIIKMRHGEPISDPCIDAWHQQAHGWVAGLVLMLEQARKKDPPSLAPQTADKSAIFDYFASEIFRNSDPRLQDLLLRTVYLPKVAVATAQRLSRNPDAERVLKDLARRNYFTVKHAEGSYDYHPLFREFLTNRAANTFSDAALRALKQESAEALAQTGHVEAAVALLKQTQDWTTLIPLITHQAPTLVAQGRFRTFGEWLQGIPVGLRESHPWLRYWTGVNGLLFDPLSALREFEHAYALFLAQDDAVGLYTTWSSIADSFVLQYGDFTPADAWIDAYELLRLRHPQFPSPELELRVSNARAGLLMFRRFSHPDLPAWADRTEALLSSISDINQRVLTAFQLGLYFVWIGKLDRADKVVPVFEEATEDTRSYGAARTCTFTFQAICHWHHGDPKRAIRFIEEAVQTAETTGAHVWKSTAVAQGVYASLAIGDSQAAQRYLDQMWKALPVSGLRGIETGHFHHMTAMTAMHNGDFAMAREHANIALESARCNGHEFGEVCNLIMSANIASACGDDKAWAQYFPAALAIGEESKSRWVIYLCRLAEAQHVIAKQPDAGLKLLRRAMALSRELNGPNLPWFPHATLVRLFGLALEHDIEREHVRGLIRRLGIAATTEVLGVEAWPWPLKIYTLGRFNVLLDDKPLAFSGRAQNKPLELLKALIALGGRGVSSATLAQTLWPDAEGDLASKTFDTTLYRLRLLLGDEKFLVLQDGQLTLDPKYCWVDAWAFERMLGQTAELQKALSLYQGPFLNKEDAAWALALRERTRSKFLRAVVRHGESLEQRSNWSAAAQWYQKGIEADHLAEELYRKLMLSYHKLGRCAEALAVYQRCAQALATVLGVAPSSETRSLFEEIRAHAARAT
jgi:DNA-binding SARP family transcriptional activator